MSRWLLIKLGESEVRNLGHPIMHEDVGALEIAMRDAHLPQIPQPIVEIQYDSIELIFCEGFLPTEPVLEIALVADFGDDVAVAVGEQRLVKLDDVGVVHLLQDADLLEDELLQPLGLQRIQRHDLYGHNFL